MGIRSLTVAIDVATCNKRHNNYTTLDIMKSAKRGQNSENLILAPIIITRNKCSKIISLSVAC